MGTTRFRSCLVAFAVVLLTSAFSPGCQSPDGSRRSIFGNRAADSTNTVMRPPYPWPETKPLYISGYAGSNYDSSLRARPFYNNAPPIALPPASSTITVDQGAWSAN